MTVAEYAEQERDARARVPARLAQMVGTMMFDAEAYPSRVSADTELWKYADAMHETRFDSTLAGPLGGALSSREFLLFKCAVEAVRTACANYSHVITPRGSLARAILLYRHLSPLGGEHRRIFEIGPGSGHLGTLLMLDGWRYGAVENAQGFFLWQQQLWQAASLIPFDHCPWWKFYSTSLPPLSKVDVVTCNHALAEMHGFALAFVLSAARVMLEPHGLFAFEGWGYERFHSSVGIKGEFARHGFICIQDAPHLIVFALSPRAVPQAAHPHDVTKAEIDAYYAKLNGTPSPDERLLATLGMAL